MNFKFAFILTNIHIVIKVISGIIMNKVISVYLGPSGMALLGQFQNTAALITSIGHGSIQTGIVKYVSSEKNNEDNLRKIISTSLTIVLGLTLLVSILTAIFSDYLGEFVFFSEDYDFILYLFSISIIFYSLNIYFLSIINGLEKVKLFTVINIALSLVTLITSSILTIYFKLSGALISIMLSQFVVFIVSLFLIKNKLNINLFDTISKGNNFNKGILGKLFKFSLATFSSGAIVSLTMIIIRNIITNSISLESAGVWESGWRILVYFNMIFAVPFSIFYFPKFSKSKDINEIKHMLYESLKLNLPLMLLLLLVIITFKKHIIIILFTEKFLELNQILNYILIAESFRVVGIFIRNIYLSQIKIFTTICFQILFFSTFIIISFYSVNVQGLIGIGFAYLMASIIYLISYCLLLHFKPPLKTIRK